MKTKVLIVTATLNFGGAERTVVDTAKALVKNKHYYPIVCSLLGGGEMQKELEGAGVEYHSLNLKSLKNVLGNIIQVRRLIKSCRPDIIHTHQSASDFYGSVGALGLHIPVISHIQNPDMPQPFSRKIIRFLISLWLIDAFIAVVEEKAESLKQMIPSAANKLYILYNTVDPKNLALPKNFDKSSYRVKLSIPKENFVVGSVGRLSWEKGYDLLLQAFAKITKAKNQEIKKSNLTLVIVGNGPEAKKLKDLAQKLEIENQVIFTGYRKDTAVLMSLFDVFVISSKLESFPLVSLEAMYLGIPVIITDRLSSKDVLSQATLVVPCSTLGLKDGIISLLENKKLRSEMSAKGRKMIEEGFTIDAYIAKLEKIYDAVLKLHS